MTFSVTSSPWHPEYRYQHGVSQQYRLFISRCSLAVAQSSDIDMILPLSAEYALLCSSIGPTSPLLIHSLIWHWKLQHNTQYILANTVYMQILIVMDQISVL